MWDDKSKEFFQNNKNFLTLAAILTLPIKGMDFIMFCDDTWTSLGAIRIRM